MLRLVAHKRSRNNRKNSNREFVNSSGRELSAGADALALERGRVRHQWIKAQNVDVVYALERAPQHQGMSEQ
jgi:hypothetical protein